LQNTRPVFENIVVPKAKDPPAIVLQSLVSQAVTAESVLSAIGFDDHTSLYTGKINDIGRYWMLPSKAPAEPIQA
jgi:hypothetical protein